MQEVKLSHSDAIVIIMNIRRLEPRRLLMDNKSSCDFIFLNSSIRLELPKMKWSLFKDRWLVSQEFMEMITPPMTIGEYMKIATKIMDYRLPCHRSLPCI